MVKFSFFLPAFKAKYLDKAISSIVQQIYKDWELLIVNDASPEDLKSIVDPYLSDPRVKYFQNEKNRGRTDLVGFWNSYIPVCSGEYLVIASDDDLYEPDFLLEMLRLSKDYPECNLLHCRTRFIDEDGFVCQIAPPALRLETQIDFVYQKIIWKRKLTLQEYCFKRTSLIAAGGVVNFPLAWYSDIATAFIMADRGVAYSNKCLFNFRVSENNLSKKEMACGPKTKAMKLYIAWLERTLPKFKSNSPDEVFMKERVLKLYKKIIYSHYHIYLPYLNTRELLHEIKYIKDHQIFSFKTRIAILMRSVLSLKTLCQ